MGRKLIAIVVLMASMIAHAASGIAQESAPPADSAEQPVTIAETEVSWFGAWQFDEDASSDEIVTLKIVDEESGDLKLVTYAEMMDETVDDAGEALDVFATAFLSTPGVSSVVEVATGELDDGAVWKVFAYDLGSVELATVFTVSERDDNTFVVSTLTAAIPEFAEVVAEAQEQILLGGKPVFLGGIDREAFLPAPVATPQATPEG